MTPTTWPRSSSPSTTSPTCRSPSSLVMTTLLFTLILKAVVLKAGLTLGQTTHSAVPTQSLQSNKILRRFKTRLEYQNYVKQIRFGDANAPLHPIVTLFITKALVLSSQNHWSSPPPKTVTSFMDDPFCYKFDLMKKILFFFFQPWLSLSSFAVVAQALVVLSVVFANQKLKIIVQLKTSSLRLYLLLCIVFSL